MNSFFFWHFQESTGGLGRLDYGRQHLENFFDLPKHDDHKAETQLVDLIIEFSQEDIENILLIHKYLPVLVQTEKRLNRTETSEIENVFRPIFQAVDVAHLAAPRVIQFRVEVANLDQNSMDQLLGKYSVEQRLFLRYMNYFEKIKRLIERHNTTSPGATLVPELRYQIKFFPPSRFHQQEGFIIQLPAMNKTHMLKAAKEQTSRTPSSDIGYATYHFAMLQLEIMHRNRRRNEAGQTAGIERFADHPQVQEVRRFLRTLGEYDFDVREIDIQQNSYEFVLKSGDRETPFRLLSSGEKEALNFIFATIAFDLRNALLVIDEPEVHLHPQWQAKMLRLYEAVSRERNLQLIIVTHSPIFVTPESIYKLWRVHRPARETWLSPRTKTNQWRERLGKERDIMDVITYTNNAKAFFADHVVLVEGVTDEVVFTAIHTAERRTERTVEFLAAGGKDNMAKYVALLRSFDIQVSIICDLDALLAGNLLSDNPAVRPVRSALARKVREAGSFEIEKVVKGSSVKERLTKREVGKRVLDCALAVERGDALSDDQKAFLKQLIDRVVDGESLLARVDLTAAFQAAGMSIETIEDLSAALAFGTEIDGEPIPLFLLTRGAIEDYFDGVGHNRGGALQAAAQIRTYLMGKRNDNPRFEELRTIIEAVQAL